MTGSAGPSKGVDADDRHAPDPVSRSVVDLTSPVALATRDRLLTRIGDEYVAGGGACRR